MPKSLLVFSSDSRTVSTWIDGCYAPKLSSANELDGNKSPESFGKNVPVLSGPLYCFWISSKARVS